MELGEKIRLARLKKHMTQADVAADKITRNMLSAIESGKANPSLDTLIYISDKLGLPLHYLLSDEADILEYEKISLMPAVRGAFADKQYSACISHAEALGFIDDEIAYILAYSHFEIAVSALKNGSLNTADKHFELALTYSDKTVYDTVNITCRIPLYLAVVRNINAPLLDFNKDAFLDTMRANIDFEFFNYVCNDWEYRYSNPLLQKHAQAKLKMKERRYYDAIIILSEIEEEKSSFEYNAYLMYCVYGDLENCYKQILDFENAYKYVSKRMSMLEGFNS